MNDIDQRVVQMQFDNKQFEEGVKDTIGTLNDLKKGLDLSQSSKNLDELYKKGKLFSLQGIANAVDSIARRFSTLGIIGMSVINNLTNAAMRFGKKMINSVWEPLVEGGLRRAEAIEQAKFQFEGLGMDVEKTMASALAAVKGTAYGLGDAALVAAQLGASGLRAGKEMTASLRGIAGVAAMTKSEYSDIGNIFTTVAGNGRLMGEQLLQLSSRGINAAAILAKYLGKSEAAVREMVSDGKISFETFTLAMDGAFGKHAQDANKLFSGALANMKAALSRIGAEVQSVKLNNFRDMLNALIPIIDNLHVALMPLITLFNDMSTATAQKVVKSLERLLELDKKFKIFSQALYGVKELIHAFLRISGAVGNAFKEVFPPKSANYILGLIRTFNAKMNAFKESLNWKKQQKIKEVFVGIFTVLKFGIKVVSTLVQAVFGLSQGLKPLLGFLGNLTVGFSAFIDGIKQSTKSVDIFSGTVDACNILGEALAHLFESLKNIGPFFVKVATVAGEAFGKLFEGISDGLEKFDIEKFFRVLNSFLFGVLLKNLGDVANQLKFFRRKGFGLDGIIGVFDKLKTTLTLWQGQLNAAILRSLAISVVMLAVGLALLASIDSDSLKSAIAAMSALFIQLALATKIITGMKMGFKAMFVVPPLLIGMATAVLILAGAMKLMSTIDWAGIAKGLISIGVLVGILVGAVKLLKRTRKDLVATGAALVLFAVAVDILASALKKIGELSVATIAKGLGAITILMFALVKFNKFIRQNLSVKTAFALIFLGVALNVLAEAVRKLGEISVGGLAKGLAAIGIILVELAMFMKLTGNRKQLISSAIAMTILGAALYIIATAIDKLGSMSVGELAKGLISLGIALALIVVAMRFMTGALPGAAALLVIAAALAILVPVLKSLGQMSLKEIFTSLGMLAGIFVIFGVAALVLGPLVPVLLALGGAIALLGLGCVLTGAGLLAVAAGLTALAAAGVAGAAGLTAMVAALIGLIPLALKKLAEGIVAFCEVVAVSGKAITGAITAVFLAILESIRMTTPEIISTLMFMLTSMVKALVTAIPMLVRAGFALLLGILCGIRDNIGQVVTTAVEVVVNFINALATGLPQIIQAGFNFIIAFINGLANSIRVNNKRVIKAAGNLLDAFVDAAREWLTAGIKKVKQIGKDIVQGMINGIKAKIDKIGSIAKTLGAALLKGIKKFLGINSPSKEMEEVGMYSVAGLAKGLKKYAGNAVSAAKNVGGKTLDAMSQAISKVNDLAAQDLSLAPTIRPIVDLNEVESGRKSIESMLGASATINTALAAQRARSISRPQGAVESAIEKVPVQGESFSFVQNNYSPKALSRLEIYRQTKNQFSALKGMVNG